jgi:hypothetical protein
MAGLVSLLHNAARMSKRGGWDNHPEYGGPEPTWWGNILILLVILTLCGLVVLAVSH